ncbi:methyltransferase domain-containing protein [Pararhodobacter sp. SW119]|uniref:class I SAM-dependent methyltransferase n=1 Tax=Pararhodobacter sp. SW119 TaxID=2780075 RepID=UPI001ADEE213
MVELGPGTGVFTAALLRRGVSPAHVAVIEASENFAAAMARRFPQVAVIHADAARVRYLSPFGPGGVGLVICGLPLLSMQPTKVLRILAGCMTVLKPDGELRLFTYGQRCPIPSAMLARLGLVTQRRTFVPLNIPPASVYAVFRKEQSA